MVSGHRFLNGWRLRAARLREGRFALALPCRSLPPATEAGLVTKDSRCPPGRGKGNVGASLDRHRKRAALPRESPEDSSRSGGRGGRIYGRLSKAKLPY